VSDEFAAASTAALLDALVAKEVAVTRRATQEFTGACLLETFGDGFTCFLHEKCGKAFENIAFTLWCKGEKQEIFQLAPSIEERPPFRGRSIIGFLTLRAK